MTQLNLFPKPEVIGISGRAGAGKDTFASALKTALEERGKAVVTLGFADPIRAATAAFGLPILSRERKEQVQSLFYDYGETEITTELYNAVEDNAIANELYVLLVDGGHIVGGEFGDCLNISARRFAQLLGDAGKACYGENYWVGRLRAKADESCADIVLVPDLRFPNELDAVDETVFIDRDVPAVAGHNSEAHFDYIRRMSLVVVDNNRDRGRLVEAAHDFIEVLGRAAP